MAGKSRSENIEYSPDFVPFLDAASPAEYGAATVTELADFLHTTYSAIYRWLKAHPDFAEAVARARAKVDDGVEHSFHRTTKGFVVELTKQRVTKDGAIVDIVEQVYIPPNVNAGQFWLRNRRPKDWKDKQVVELDVTGTFADRVEEAFQEVLRRRGEIE